MDATAVHEAAAATLAGIMPFPQIVAKLLEAGVEYYHVDYVGRSKHFYDGNGTCVLTPIPFEELPPVAAELDIEALRDDIRDSQQKGQHYRDFTVRAMRAGVQGYFAFLRGQRVTYIGRTGDQHTEWFPGAGPKKS
jgi:uncharacterized protein YbcV (DUF1398 family)